MSVRRGDNVLVISGKDKGKTGRVEHNITEKDRIVVAGVNIVTRHLKARPGIQQSGRVQQESSIHISNVLLICNKCNAPIKSKTTTLDTGKRVRSCPKCEEIIDDVS